VRKLNVRFDPATVEGRIAATRGLAIHLATRYARRYPRIELDDLAQECLQTLTRAAQLYRGRADGPPFSAFALLCLKQCCWAHVRKMRRRENEVSLDEVISWDGDDPLTVFDVLDYRRASMAEAARPARAHEAARYAELRLLIETLDTLTPLERRVLRLRYVVGLEVPQICRRIGRCYVTVSTASASGVRKLQRHYGIETKPERVKHFSPAHHANHHVKKRAPHPDCPYCHLSNLTM
jgi:RNA polymerase sigma factor (sigma-70 family)